MVLITARPVHTRPRATLTYIDKRLRLTPKREHYLCTYYRICTRCVLSDLRLWLMV